MKALLVVLVACGGAPPPAAITNAGASTTTEPVALAIVLQEQELFLGNDDFETDPAAIYRGALHDVEKGVAALRLPPGSTIAVIGYSTGAHPVLARRAASDLPAHPLGIQRDYRNKIGTDVVQGVELGLASLASASAAHKVLVVIGDGNDTNNDLGAPRLVDDAKHAAAAHVAVHALVWKTVVSADGEIIHSLTPNVKTLEHAADFVTALPIAAQ